MTTTEMSETAETADDAVDSTRSRATTIIGWGVVIGLLAVLAFAFVFSPADQRLNEMTGGIEGQQDAVRMLYIHFPSILIAYGSFGICAVASAMYLWKRTAGWDVLAGATGEIGAVFLGICLFTGMVWGRPIWNTWWEWGDVRLMTTLMLFLMFIGYVAIRSLDIDRSLRAKRSAIVALMAVVLIPIVSQSVNWWENSTLHQRSSAVELRYQNLTLFTLFLSLTVFSLLFTWLLMHRFRVGWLDYEYEQEGFSEALTARRSEADHGVDAAVRRSSRSEER